MENALMKAITLTGLCVLFAMATTGCSKTNSSNVKTSGIYVSFSVEGNNQNSATCQAQFQVGGPTGTYLDLDSGDSVTCQGQPMGRSEFAGIVTYSAPVSYVPGGTYSVTFTRPNEKAYVATVSLPEPISGMNPMNFRSYQKGRPFSVNWTPSMNGADSMMVGLSYQAGKGSSYRSRSGGQPETGIVGFGGEDTTENPPISGTYSGTLEYTRSRGGAVPAPMSGNISGLQKFSVPIQLTD